MRRHLFGLALTVATLASCKATEPESQPSLSVINGDHQSAEFGAALPQPVTVRLAHTDGTPVVGERIEWNVTAGGGSVSPAYSVTDANGTGQTDWTVGPCCSAPQELTVSFGNVHALVTAQGLKPVAGSLTVAGDGQAAPFGGALPSPISVTVTSTSNRPVSGAVVNWAVTAGGGSVSPAQSTTDADGVARTQWTLGPCCAALNTLQVTVAETLGATLTANAAIPAQATLSVGGGSWQSIAYLHEGDDPLTVTLKAEDGRPISGARIQWQSRGAVSPSSPVTTTSSTGTATVTAIAGNELAIDTVRASVVGTTEIAPASFPEVARPSVTNQDVLLTNGGVIWAGVAATAEIFPLLIGAPWDPFLAAGSLPTNQDGSWSPNGRSIAYANNASGSYDIYVATADGGRSTRITSDALDERRPVWSPDGTRIAFERGTDIFIMNADGSGAMPLTTGSQPAWSPDGHQLVFTKGGFLYTIAVAGGAATKLTADTSGTTGASLHQWDPAWSTDGKSITYSRVSEAYDASEADRALFEFNLETRTRTARARPFAHASCWANADKVVVSVGDDEWWARFGIELAVYDPSIGWTETSLQRFIKDPFITTFQMPRFQMQTSQGCR